MQKIKCEWTKRCWTHLFKIIVQSPWSSASGNFSMEAFVDSLNSLSISSISKTNGCCPKFASTISPGVWSPTVGYSFDYTRMQKKNKEEKISWMTNKNLSWCIGWSVILFISALPVDLEMRCPDCDHFSCKNMCLWLNSRHNRWYRQW